MIRFNSDYHRINIDLCHILCTSELDEVRESLFEMVERDLQKISNDVYESKSKGKPLDPSDAAIIYENLHAVGYVLLLLKEMANQDQPDDDWEGEAYVNPDKKNFSQVMNDLDRLINKINKEEKFYQFEDELHELSQIQKYYMERLQKFAYEPHGYFEDVYRYFEGKVKPKEITVK